MGQNELQTGLSLGGNVSHGAKLAKHVLDYAREAGLKVVPACPFIAAYMRRHPEYEDLRALPD